jgi:HrpA-like RNA helicase
MPKYAGVTSTGKSWVINTDSLLPWAQHLPMKDELNDIVEGLVTKPVTVIIAETGSGKSLLIQWIVGQLQDQGLLPQGEQILAQPLVETARGLRETVEQVANEAVSLFTGPEKHRIPGSRFSIGTAGSLIFRIKNASILIADEAHEQHIDTTLFIGAGCLDLIKNPHKKFLFLSATFDKENIRRVKRLFGENNVAVVTVGGRQYDLHKTMWELGGITFEQQQVDFVKKIVDEALPKLSGNHTALVFVPSPKYFPKLVDTLREELDTRYHRYEVITFSGADRGRQITPHSGWFDAVDWNGRQPEMINLETYIRLGASREKPSIIFNTDVFRTGISVLNVEVSVTAGQQVRPYYNAALGYGGTAEELTSMQGIIQELGRAARFMEGYGFYVYAEDRPAIDIPAIKRHAMAQTVLKLIGLGFDPLTFPFLDEPEEGAIPKALEALQELLAIEEVDGKWHRTSLGVAMSSVNAEPHLSRMAIEADRQGCLAEMIIAIAERQGRGLFWNPEVAAKWENQPLSKLEIQSRQSYWKDPTSDYLTTLKIWRGWVLSDFDRNFGADNGIYQKALADLERAARKMVDALDGVAYELNGDGRRTMWIRYADLYQVGEPDDTRKAAIGKAVLSGMPANLFRFSGRNAYASVVRDGAYYIFPGSSAFHGQPRWLVAQFEAQRGQDPNDPWKFWLKGVHGIDKPVEWIMEVAPHLITATNNRTYYDVVTDTIQAERSLKLKGEYFGDDVVTLKSGEEAARIFAEALANRRVQLPCVFANAQKMAEVESLNSRLQDTLGTISTSMLATWYVGKLGTVCTRAKVEELGLDLVLKDADVSALLGMDYAQKRASVLKDRPDSWKIANVAYPLTYKWETGWGGFKGVELQLPVAAIASLTSDQLPSWKDLEVRVKVSDEGYSSVNGIVTDLDTFRNQIELRRQELAWNECMSSVGGSQRFTTRFGEELPNIPTRRMWDHVNGSYAYPELVHSYTESAINGLTYWNLKWFKTFEEAERAYHVAVAKKTEADAAELALRELDIIKTEAFVLYREVEGLWRQIDLSNYTLYGLTHNEADPNGYYGSQSLSGKLYEARNFINGNAYPYRAQPQKAIEVLQSLKERVQQALDKYNIHMAEKTHLELLDQEQRGRDEEWQAYVTKREEIKQQYGNFPGFGLYSFEVTDQGMPKANPHGIFIDTFDWDTSEEIPENGKTYWGVVAQEFSEGGYRKRKITLLLEECTRATFQFSSKVS